MGLPRPISLDSSKAPFLIFCSCGACIDIGRFNTRRNGDGDDIGVDGAGAGAGDSDDNFSLVADNFLVGVFDERFDASFDVDLPMMMRR